MEKSCFRKEECKLFKEAQPCSGCGFQHYADVLKAHGNILSVKEIGDRYFKYIPEHRGVREGKVSTGGRVAIDVPLREFMENKLPQLQSIERKKLTLHLKGENFIPKADGIFKTKNASKYLFYEIKGYGDDTNSILSAITAAKLLSLVDEKIDSYYYYIGICSGSKKNGGGLQRKSFIETERIAIRPYINWAEKERLLKFFGIVDIDDMIDDIRKVFSIN